MALDPENKNPGYVVGRLFAVLEKLQETALPGLNATIRDRYYAAASCTPGVVFPQLMRLKNHHIAKLDNRGLAVYYERLIGEVCDLLPELPARLDLGDQGRFAIGYYHQRQDLFKTKNSKEE